MFFLFPRLEHPAEWICALQIFIIIISSNLDKEG